MATEAKKKQQNNTEETAVAQVHTGDGGQPSRSRQLRVPKRKLTLKKIELKRKSAIYVFTALIVIIGACIAAHLFLHVGQKVYAQADGHKIYKEDVDKLRGTTKGLSDHQVATVLANKYLYQAMAKKAGITVTNSDVEAQYPNVTPKNTSAYIWQYDVNSVYMNRLMAYNVGLYKGKVLVAYFNRYVPFQSSLLAERKAIEPLIGNKAAINADKKYAHDFITNLYTQLKKHQITFDQAIQKEKSDPRLGPQVYSPQSGPFDTSNIYLGGTVLVKPKSAQTKMATIKTGQLSKPFIVSVSNSWDNPNVTAPAYYLVVQMDYSKSSHSGLTWDKYLVQQQEQYHYKVNV